MNELRFALYGTLSQFVDHIPPLLKEFEARSQTLIRTTEMTLDDAWPQLFNYTIHGGGPDLVRIGTIWASSLVALNIFRPFKDEEITRLGGADVFFEPLWQDSVISSSFGPAHWGFSSPSFRRFFTASSYWPILA